jgi:hypothetical protein
MSAAPGPAVFCDTSVLLSYVLDQDGPGVERLLIESDRPKVISETVDREFHRVPDRREAVYRDFLRLVTADDESVAEATVAERDYLRPNDAGFFRTLRDEITRAEDVEAKLTTIREKQRIVDRRFGRLEQILNEVYPRSDDIALLLSLGSVVDNEDDCQVLCDAVAWSADGGSGAFTSLDRDDIVSNAEQIDDAVRENYSPSATLDIAPPAEFHDG